MPITVNHSTPADGTFSATGATAWDANHTLSGVGTMAEQNANAVAITGGTATLTSVTTPIVQATNSAGLALKNSAGTTQISMGAGGGDNVTVAVSTNLNGTNAQIDISPTGTGHVHIKPTGVNSVEIAPTFVGEMDNITIGSITPKAGTFTTITGQTEVLKGTGTNLLTYSQSFTAGGWVFALGTFTTNTATDPLGTTTAATLTMNGASTANFYKAVTVTSGITYTWSIYAKAGTTSSIQLECYATAGIYNVAVNLSTGTITGTTGTGTSTITSAGNGWYRITGTATATAAGTGYLQVNVVGNANTCFLWGAQLEVGTTANAFLATTTTAIYGTPTLSFSGVAGLGLQSDGSLYVSPAGTGALQAQATTSSTAGGNARGANATDFQKSRFLASQVASGSSSTIGGGLQSTASGYATTVAGGDTNTANQTYSFVGGGNSNTASGQSSSVVCGASNSATGYFGFVGNGFTNSTTSNSAVTTQSGTMNATTAVTLSGSNASIKVGQYIIGTSIAANTYVAAISGTSLTLSQNASGSSTSTLSFYTPHGVVVGGGNNQATGSYSFIGGGGDAGTTANRNSVVGDWSAVVGGSTNSITSGSNYSFIGGGLNSSISSSATYATISGGRNNSVSAYAGVVAGGQNNLVSGTYSSIIGGYQGTTRSITGNTAFAACVAPIAFASGVSQSALLVLGRQTTDATATALTSDSSAASGTNQVILPNNSAYFFTGEVVSGVTGGGDTKGWSIEGVIKRGAGVGTTALVGTPTVTSLYADVGAATWAIAVTADTTNGGIRVTFTGQAATTIRTVCRISSVEMTY